MKSLIIIAAFVSSCTVVLGENSQQRIVPKEGLEREDWIFEHHGELTKKQFAMLKVPLKYPKEANRVASVELAKSVKVGVSFKVVLAVLGIPHWQANESGGSGPATMPSTWWIYSLSNGNQLCLTINLNDSLSDAIVVHRKVLTPKSKGFWKGKK